jgi:hypothetical protein
MTNLLEKAINRISKLSEMEQDHIAQLILDEIENEKNSRILSVALKMNY